MTRKTTTTGIIHKIGVAIITAIILGALTFAAGSILEHNERIIRLEEREKSSKELLIEVRKDVKQILQRIKR